MFPATNQYLISGFVWIIFFLVVYFDRKHIITKLKGIDKCYKTKFSLWTYILIIIYLIFLILNITGIIQHKIVPWMDYLVIFLVTGFVGPIAEEIIFRGFFVGFFKQTLQLKSLKLILWVIGVNLFFSLVHNIGAIHPKPFIELLKTFILGIVLTFVYLVSRKNILYPTLIHLANNMILMYFILN